MGFALLCMQGCASPVDSVCVSLTRPPFTDADVDAVSDGLAKWLLTTDQFLEGKCS